MSERTLREKIEALKSTPYDRRVQLSQTWNAAIDEVLALLDAHTAEQPAPDAVAEAMTIADGIIKAGQVIRQTSTSRSRNEYARGMVEAAKEIRHALAKGHQP